MNKKGEKNVRFNEKKHIFAPKTIKNTFFLLKIVQTLSFKKTETYII